MAQIEAPCARSARAIPMTISSIRKSRCAATDEVGVELRTALIERLSVAGITVDECG
jgi:hypothetical protein